MDLALSRAPTRRLGRGAHRRDDRRFLRVIHLNERSLQVTPLREHMIEEKGLRNFARATVDAYVDNVAKFAEHFGRGPGLGPAPARAEPPSATGEAREPARPNPPSARRSHVESVRLARQ